MIRVEKTHLPVAALTHPGMKGKNNEDRFGVSAFRSPTQPPVSVLLAVLSDGIGGNRAGEVASELAVNLISQAAADSDGRNPPQILETAIQAASERIRQQAQDNLEQHGMGATCACAWIAGDRLYTATVGDSRIYLMRNGGIYQLSTDHTWIQEAIERGLLEPEQAAGHPNAHVIRRYLGSPTPPEVDFRLNLASSVAANGEGAGELMGQNQGMRLLPNDRLLLCSDGLTDLVNANEILESFEKSSLEEAGQQLIDLANQRGGHDNITLVVVQVPSVRPKAVPVAAPILPVRAKTALAGCLAVIILAVVLGGLAGGWLLFRDNQATETPTVTPTSLVTPTASPTPTRTRTPRITLTPLNPGVTLTSTLAVQQGVIATITTWPTNTPRLPIVTVTNLP